MLVIVMAVAMVSGVQVVIWCARAEAEVSLAIRERLPFLVTAILHGPHGAWCFD